MRLSLSRGPHLANWSPLLMSSHASDRPLTGALSSGCNPRCGSGVRVRKVGKRCRGGEVAKSQPEVSCTSIAAARASAGGRAQSQLGGAHREYAHRRQPAPHAARLTLDAPARAQPKTDSRGYHSASSRPRDLRGGHHGSPAHAEDRPSTQTATPYRFPHDRDGRESSFATLGHLLLPLCVAIPVAPVRSWNPPLNRE